MCTWNLETQHYRTLWNQETQHSQLYEIKRLNAYLRRSFQQKSNICKEEVSSFHILSQSFHLMSSFDLIHLVRVLGTCVCYCDEVLKQREKDLLNRRHPYRWIYDYVYDATSYASSNRPLSLKNSKTWEKTICIKNLFVYKTLIQSENVIITILTAWKLHVIHLEAKKIAQILSHPQKILKQKSSGGQI